MKWENRSKYEIGGVKWHHITEIPWEFHEILFSCCKEVLDLRRGETTKWKNWPTDTKMILDGQPDYCIYPLLLTVDLMSKQFHLAKHQTLFIYTLCNLRQNKRQNKVFSVVKPKSFKYEVKKSVLNKYLWTQILFFYVAFINHLP